MNFKEIIEEIKKQEIKIKDFAHCDIENPFPNIGQWIEVDQVGGEGEGDHWHSVVHFIDHDVYIKTSGHYSSYDGIDFWNDFDSCEEVKPQQKMITVYE